ILVTSWWSFPYAMVIVTAAIQSIPRELYEAVSIDGGSWRAKLRYVTWPHLIPTLGSTALTLGILYLTLITLLIVLTRGGPVGDLDFPEERGERGVGDSEPHSIAGHAFQLSQRLLAQDVRNRASEFHPLCGGCRRDRLGGRNSGGIRGIAIHISWQAFRHADHPRDIDGPRSCTPRSNLLSARSPRSSEQSFRPTRHPGLTHRAANGVVHAELH